MFSRELPRGEVEERRPTEQEKVERWRTEELYRAGMPIELAENIARFDGWRDALNALRKGCDPKLAAEIAR